MLDTLKGLLQLCDLSSLPYDFMLLTDIQGDLQKKLSHNHKNLGTSNDKDFESVKYGAGQEGTSPVLTQEFTTDKLQSSELGLQRETIRPKKEGTEGKN